MRSIPERLAAKIQSLFADAPASERETPARIADPRRGPPPQVGPGPVGGGDLAVAGPTEVFQLIAKAQARIVLGYPGVTVRDPDRFALEVLAEVLGGSGGRLATLVQPRGLVDAVTASSREGVDPGTFTVAVALRPDAVDALVPILRAELGRVGESGVTPDEVARARRILTGTHALTLERRGAVAYALALGAAFGETGQFRRHGVDELSKVTADDVVRVARRIIDPRREVLAVVRPRAPERPTTSMVDRRSGYTGP